MASSSSMRSISIRGPYLGGGEVHFLFSALQFGRGDFETRVVGWWRSRFAAIFPTLHDAVIVAEVGAGEIFGGYVGDGSDSVILGRKYVAISVALSAKKGVKGGFEDYYNFWHAAL